MFEFSRRVDGKYSRDRDTHSSVGIRVIWTVPVTSKERVPAEQGLNVFETSDLELLGVPVNDLPLEGVDERGGIEEDGSVRQEDVSLLDTLEVILGDGGLADSSLSCCTGQPGSAHGVTNCLFLILLNY